MTASCSVPAALWAVSKRTAPGLGAELDAFEHVEVIVELLAGAAVAEPLDRLRERSHRVERVLVLVGDGLSQIIERLPQEPEDLVRTLAHVAVGYVVYQRAQTMQLLDDLLRQLTCRCVDHRRQRRAADVRLAPKRAHLVRVELAHRRREQLRQPVFAFGGPQRCARKLHQRDQHGFHRERPVLADHHERDAFAIERAPDRARRGSVPPHDDRDVAPPDAFARAQPVALARDRVGLLGEVIELPGLRFGRPAMAARQFDRLRAGKRLCERGAGVRQAAAEAVDARVGVDRRSDRTASDEERAQQLVLRGRDILVVVDEQVLGLGTDLVGYVLAFVQQLPCARDHVGVVDDGVVARVQRG